MAATETAYRVLDLEEAALSAGEDNRRRVPLRRDFDIAAFGVNAIYQAKAGEPVIRKHDEISPFAGGHEELYVVLKGGCTFSVEGDEIDAPAGHGRLRPRSRCDPELRRDRGRDDRPRGRRQARRGVPPSPL